MTHRLTMILTAGLAVIAATAGLALVVLHRSTEPPAPSPTWGIFDATQWRAVASRLPGFDPASLQVVTAMPKRDGTPFAIVAGRRTTGDMCFVVVRGITPAAPICRFEKPLFAFTMRDGRFVDVVGLARRDIASVVIDAQGQREGAALLPAGPVNAFGFGHAGAPVLEALGGSATVVGKLYCASALRGVCGTSAQRRS
jgi:hypothetical protein